MATACLLCRKILERKNMKGIRILSLLAILLLTAAGVTAKVWTPEDMVNPNIASRFDYVCDPADLMDATTKRAVNERLYSLRQQTSVEFMVALPPDIGDATIEEWSEALFREWGIGKKDKDNGVLLVIAPEQRRTRFEIGYGCEGVLTDIACKNIISQAIVPAMRDNDINAAVGNAVSLACDALTDPAVAGELKSAEADNYSGAMKVLSKDVLWEFVSIVALCMFLLSLAIFIYDLVTMRKVDNHGKALTWRRHLTTFLVLGILSLGAGLIFWLLALWLYRVMRNRRIKCPTCGAKMNKLSEEEDNQLLNDSQDFEERMKSVDYDVYECPKCGTVERFPYISKNTKYTECPRCHTRAMTLVKDVVTVQATTRRPGQGVKIYECKFCHHREEKPYTIPKKENPGAALAAAAVIGSMGRGGSGGGFGGGLGGGMSGGGGASGSW